MIYIQNLDYIKDIISSLKIQFKEKHENINVDKLFTNELNSKSKIETYNLIPGKPIAYWLNPVYFDNYKDNQTLNDKIDITSLMVWLLGNFPNSVFKLKSDNNVQFNFCYHK